MACGPGHPELSKSYMDMASTLFTFTFTQSWRQAGAHRGRQSKQDHYDKSQTLQMAMFYSDAAASVSQRSLVLC